MNYVHLAKKYGGVDCICNDRTWDGLIWPSDKGSKPTVIIFQAWQKEEERMARVEGYHASVMSDNLEQKAAAARNKALADIVPYAEVVRAKEQAEYDKAIQIQKGAIECQAILRMKKELETKCWKEISKAQDLINQEAQAYLEETAFVLAWDHTAVPAEIAEKRAEAQKRIQLGRTVYADWNYLRAKEMPTQAEIHEALQKGGEHVERIRDIAKQAALRYPRPRTTY